MGEGKAVFIKGHTDGHLSAVIALLLVFPVFGLWILGANALEVGVSHVVENHAAVEAEEVPRLFAQADFDGFAVLEQFVADPVKAVFGGFAQAHVEEFRQGGALSPVDERPFAEWLDEAVSHHHLGGGDGGWIHAEVIEHRGEIQCVPGFHGHELRPEVHAFPRFHFVEQDAVNNRPADRFGGHLGAFDKLGDLNDPSGGLRRESFI